MSKRTHTVVDDDTSDDSGDNPIKSPRSGEEFLFPDIEDPDSSDDLDICWSGSSLLNLTNAGSPMVLTQGGGESLSGSKILSQSSSTDHHDFKSSQVATIILNQATPEELDYSSESAEHLSTAEDEFSHSSLD